MKSIEVILPRFVIKKFYLHPESYGDYIVDLINGMYTDIYLNVDTKEYFTITNDEKLIDYLNMCNKK